MRYHVRSYRNGYRILKASSAFDEIALVIDGLPMSEVQRHRESNQARYNERAKENGGVPRKAGVQAGLNAALRDRFVAKGWHPEVALFEADSETEKGLWKMDFAKQFPESGMSVGVEVTFNHGEALSWTPIRLSLAHEAEGVLPDARISVGCIIIGTDQLKGSRRMGLRMDSAVGTFERMLTLLPKMRPVLPAPLVIFGVDWGDGGMVGRPLEVDLHTSVVASRSVAGDPER